MKKATFGIMIVMIGFFFTAYCFIFASLHTGNYNGSWGFHTGFLFTKTLWPFIISFCVMCSGLYICWREAYLKK